MELKLTQGGAPSLRKDAFSHHIISTVKKQSGFLGCEEQPSFTYSLFCPLIYVRPRDELLSCGRCWTRCWAVALPLAGSSSNNSPAKVGDAGHPASRVGRVGVPFNIHTSLFVFIPLLCCSPNVSISLCLSFYQPLAMASQNSTCPASLDNVFGPQVDTCRRAFDFTQVFEESFLSIIPSVFFLVAAAFRLFALHRDGRKGASGSPFQIAKLVGPQINILT